MRFPISPGGPCPSECANWHTGPDQRVLVEVLAFDPTRRHPPRRARRHGQIALAHRARLRGTQKRARPRPFRRAKLARIPPSRHPLHRRLRFSHPRTSGDSPLRPPAARNVSPILASQTPRRRQYDPNGISKTRSRRSEDTSRSRWREPKRAVRVAKPCHSDHLIKDRRDTGELAFRQLCRGFELTQRRFPSPLGAVLIPGRRRHAESRTRASPVKVCAHSGTFLPANCS